MKKFLVLTGIVMMLAVGSCTPGDGPVLRFESLSVTEVDFPQNIEALKSYEVNVTYLRPSSCHSFEGFDYEETGTNETTVYLIASVFDDQQCQALTEYREASFEFRPENPGDYVFKFWQGENAEGQDIYYTVDVTVTQKVASTY